ncbi:anti-sigma factor family protein [Streptomyces ovatisporus]|uniref:Anti-sigma factor family protein n=1 Tax=Streptomyces ovatisporus TaxID=1128682 RepID=A0ABV9A3A5_9ACTN
MSGTGMGRQLPQPERGLTPAEQHLGDRLAALIDGELGHDARERVLAHLATCRNCKAEADAQRRVKNVFADTAPPPPSDGLLARLQGLPAGGPDGPSDADGSGGPHRGAGGGLLGGRPRTSPGSMPGGSGNSSWTFDYLRGGRAESALSPSRGFGIHETDRPSSRGRRFAFAAAGAVSLAALALGGGLGPGPAGSSPAAAKGDAGGASASSVRTTSTATGTERDRRRRDTGGVRSERGGALSVNSATGSSVGAAAKTEQDVAFHRGAPWAAPTAPRSSRERPDTVLPLLREVLLDSPLTRSALPSFAYNSYGTEPYTGTTVDAFSGGAPEESAPVPAPSPVVTAAPPQG